MPRWNSVFVTLAVLAVGPALRGIWVGLDGRIQPSGFPSPPEYYYPLEQKQQQRQQQRHQPQPRPRPQHLHDDGTHREWIDLNPNSFMSSDLKGIWHDSSESLITIELHDDEGAALGCPNPALRGRLSGPSLIILDFGNKEAQQQPQQQQQQQQKQRQASETLAAAGAVANGTRDPRSKQRFLTGRYHHVPFGGLYFIEIIVLYCLDIDANTDFKEACLVPAEQHRLTAWNASIHVAVTTSTTTSTTTTTTTTTTSSTKPNQKKQKIVLGHWIDKAHARHRGKNDSSLVPLHTRYQPADCRDTVCVRLGKGLHGRRRCTKRKINTTLGPHCTRPMDTTRFQPYEFQWSSMIFRKSFSFQLWKHPMNQIETLCFIGASHSRVMVEHLSIPKWNRLFPKGKVEFHYIKTSTPKDLMNIDPNSIRHCSRIILGMGQWPASFYGRMTVVAQYEKQLDQALHHLQQIYTNKLFFRSMHYNPLGDVKLACPPKDWRNPRVVDLYNQAHERLALQHNITYVDSNFIIGPMWDEALDFCHYREKAGVVDALFVAARALGAV